MIFAPRLCMMEESEGVRDGVDSRQVLQVVDGDLNGLCDAALHYGRARSGSGKVRMTDRCCRWWTVT